MSQRFVVRAGPAGSRVTGDVAALRPAARRAAPALARAVLVTPADARRTRPSPIEGLEGRTYFAVTTDAGGWTVVTPAADSRIVYVSAAGNDNNTGLSASSPFATIAKAKTLVRSGFADQLLLRRGDTFGQNLQQWGLSGRSAAEPLVIGAYTDPAAPSAARPRLNTGIGNGMSVPAAGVSHVFVMGIAFEADQRDYREAPANFTTDFRTDAAGGTYGVNGTGKLTDFLVEDCAFQYYKSNLVFQPSGTNAPSNVRVRRSVIADAYAVNVDKFGIAMGSSQAALGIYADGVDGLTVDGNTLEHNGWAADDALGARRNVYSHNLYLNSGNNNVVVTNNVIADAASHGLQMRAGGVVSNNLFLRNPIAMSYGYVNGAGTMKAGGVSGQITDNVVVGDNSIYADARGWGLEIANLKPASQGGGTVVRNNVFANDSQNAFPAIQVAIPGSTTVADAGINDLTIEQNLVYSWYRGLVIQSGYGSSTHPLTGLVVRANDFQRLTATGDIVNHSATYVAAQETWANNRYDNATPETGTNKWFKLGSASIAFAQWQAQVEPSAVKATGIFPDPGRSAGGYNASIGGAGGNSTDAFVAQAMRQGKAFWRPAYTADAAGDWIRAGYAGGRVDVSAPTAAGTAADVTIAGATGYTVTVAYADDNKVDPASIDPADVTVTGPNGYAAVASAVASSTGPADGRKRTVTYRVPAPAGGWSAAANGIYAVTVAAGQVLDAAGRAVAAGTVATFAVSIDPAVPAAVAAAATVVSDTAAAAVSVTYAGGTTPALPADATPADAGFEAVSVGGSDGGFAYNPTGSAWTFANGAGLAADASGFTGGNPTAPQGTQVAFLQIAGSMTQAVAGWAAGTYTVAFQAAQRGNNGVSVHDFAVLIDGQVIGTFTPASTAYQAYATAAFTVPAGTHTVEFRGLNTAGGDNTSLVDAVRIVGTTAPVQQQLSAASFDPADVRVTGPAGVVVAASAASAAADDPTDGVVRTVTYSIPAPAGGWSSAGASSLAVEVVAGQVLSTTGAAARAGRVGTLSVGVSAPVAVAINAPDVTAGAASPATFTVSYADDNPGAALAASVDSGDLRVTGPGGFNAAVTLVSATRDGTAASPLAATYQVNPPAAGWGSAANGTYWLMAQPNQVTDADGNALAAGAIGSFRVAVDTTAPLAWASESDITNPFTTDKVLEVSYYDASGINAATLAAANVRVVGPNGWSSAVTKGTTTTGGTAAYVEYALPARDGRWQSGHNGTYSIVLQPNQVADARGNAAAAGVTIATFAVAIETVAPTASAAAANVTAASTAAVTITATYADDVATNPDTFDSNDLTVAGPGGYAAAATFVATTTSGATRTVTYTVPAPAGGWAVGNNGTYAIKLAAGQVRDLAGNAAAAGTIGSFAVAVPLPPPPPPATTLVIDGGFESPALADGGYVYAPAGSAWTYTSFAWVSDVPTATLLTTGGNIYTAGAAAAPEGRQVLGVQGYGVAGQAISVGTAGTYVLSLKAAQRTVDGVAQTQAIDVRVDGASVGTVTPTDATTFEAFSLPAVALTAGPHALALVGLAPTGGDQTAFVDDVRLTLSPASPPVVVPPPPPVVVAPTADLYNSTTDTKIATLTDGYTIDLNAVGTRLNIRGLPAAGTTAGSIEFRIDGTTIKTESFAPYTIGGDGTNAAGGVDYLDWTPPVGTHTLTVVQWSGASASGTATGTTNLAFTTIAVVDRTPPTAAVAAVSPNPRTAPVDAVTVTFGEPVTGFDVADLALTRDGQPVGLDGVTVTPVGTAGTTFTVAGLTAATTPAGTYSLALVAASSGIADAAGNALVMSAAAGWTVTPPAPAPTATAAAASSGAASRFAQLVTVTGTDFPADATAVLRDAATGAALSGVTVVSRSATQVVVAARLGSAARSLTAEVTGSTGTSAAVGFAVAAEAGLTAAGAVDATAGKTAALTAAGPAGLNVVYTWAVTSAPAGAPPVAYSANGTAAAARTTATFGKAGSYTFQVTASDGAASAVAAVVLTVTAKLTTIAVTPATATVALGKTQPFAAAGADQFGTALSAAVTWSVASGGVGTVSSAGLYTAPATGSGSASVKATSGSIVGQAAVTVPAVAAAFTSAKIHFRPSSAPAVSGYLADSGLTYAARNGLTYGWSVSHADVVVDRNKNSNQLFDTNVGIKAGAKWEIAVPNGKYNVRVSIGDSAAASTNTVRLEGTSVFSAQKEAANVFGSRLVSVTVTDGKLTLDAGSAAGGLTRVNYVEVTKV